MSCISVEESVSCIMLKQVCPVLVLKQVCPVIVLKQSVSCISVEESVSCIRVQASVSYSNEASLMRSTVLLILDDPLFTRADRNLSKRTKLLSQLKLTSAA